MSNLFFFPFDFSYLYHFDTNDWSAVYKHTARKDLKFKAGYDSSVDGGLKWACVWVCWFSLFSISLSLSLSLSLYLSHLFCNEKSMVYFLYLNLLDWR
jgi:hypothetical protein